MGKAASLFSTAFLFLTILVISLLTLLNQSKVEEILSSQVTLIEEPRIRIVYKELMSPEDILPVECERTIPVTYTKVVSLENLPPEERKKRFSDLLLPSVLIANYEVSYIRKNLTKVLNKLNRGLKLSKKEVEFVEDLLERCKADSIEEVLIKVNPVPPSLVIAQAAIESGWGTSRFFVEGNNPFGIRTFKDDGNVIPAKESDAILRKFASILDAVRSYLYNINVGWAYEKFRRHRLRSYNSIHLSEFLDSYSVERYRYVRKVKRIIKENNLSRFDLCSLDPSYLR